MRIFLAIAIAQLFFTTNGYAQNKFYPLEGVFRISIQRDDARIALEERCPEEFQNVPYDVETVLTLTRFENDIISIESNPSIPGMKGLGLFTTFSPPHTPATVVYNAFGLTILPNQNTIGLALTVQSNNLSSIDVVYEFQREIGSRTCRLQLAGRAVKIR